MEPDTGWEEVMFRNREVQKFTIWYIVITVILAAAGFTVHSAAGIFALISAAAFGAAFFIFTRERYRRIADISEQIDLVLHDQDHVFISGEEEGELAILESEITKMTLRIREQNKALIKEKTNLADSLADIAHQLRTPLTSANLTFSLLKDHPDERELRTLLREAEGLFAQMDWLLTSLLKLSRLDAGVVVFQKEKIAVAKLINDAVHSFQIALELHNISIHTDIPKGVVLYGDERWLSEALKNILKNCMESAGDDGKIEITCEDNLLFTVIQIHDSGPGFSKEDLAGLFDRFYRGKNTDTAGYGIGLALSKTIIIRQGGTIKAKNHPQGGAVFSIRFSK